MKVATIGVRELRDGLSRHLADVRGGAQITVTDHGRPIARLLPIEHESALEALIREGFVTLPDSVKTTHLPPVEASGTVSDLISEQRR